MACLALLVCSASMAWHVPGAAAATGPAPTVAGVAPAAGNPGTSVTITGADLSGATVVDFGTTAAPGFTVNGTGTAITVAAPAGPMGTVDITVSTPGGTSTTSPADDFTYSTGATYPPFGFVFGTAGYENAAAYGNPTVSVQEQYAAYTSWASMVSSVQSNAAAWASYGSRLVLGVGIIPTGTSFPATGNLSGSTLTSLQSTATSIAQALVSANLGNAIIRLGWEFNGSWYPWAAQGNPGAYANAFQVWVTQMRAVAGADFQFEWCSIQAQGWNIASAYPGDSYVDYIGSDPYDEDYTYTPNNTPTQSALTWSNILGTSGSPAYTYDSLDALVAFSAAHDKQVSLPEWGCWFRTDGHGLGDDPGYIQDIYNFVTNPADRVGYFNYFSDDEAGDGNHSLSDGSFPNALGRFELLFGHPSPPTVTAVSPSSGTPAGGTTVTVTGTNLTGATAVAFGSVPATAVTVASASQLTATAPAEAAGTVNITVTTPGGTSAISSADRFTYGTAPVTVAAVGTLGNKSGKGVTSLALTPQHLGDLMVLAVKVGSSTVTASSVTGGGVGGWARIEGPYTHYSGTDLELWAGVVSATGPATVTVAFSAGVSSTYTGLAVQEFSASVGSAAVWGLDNGAGVSNASSTSVAFPKLTPSGTGELYFGYAAAAQNGSGKSASGITYATTADADVVAYDTNVSTALQPVATSSPAGASGAVGILVTVT
jgi:hypothetical protein